MNAPQWQTPQETIEENIKWLRTCARDAAERGLERLCDQLDSCANAIEESVAEIEKDRTSHNRGDEEE